jgi:hypothetical protein
MFEKLNLTKTLVSGAGYNRSPFRLPIQPACRFGGFLMRERTAPVSLKAVVAKMQRYGWTLLGGTVFSNSKARPINLGRAFCRVGGCHV